MAHAGFVHLRVHTAYSLSEGAIRVKDLAKLCQKAAMPAVAMTDTNNLFGALEFSESCAKGGIQPIVGCQLDIAREEAEARVPGRLPGAGGPKSDPLVLLVQNREGYGNLLKLLGEAYMGSADASEPKVSLSFLECHAGGLIALTGGAAGAVGRLLGEGQAEAAEALLLRLAAAFSGRLYVELQRHGTEAEAAVEDALIDLAYRHGLPLVATNETFFASRDMYESHDALLCIAGGTTLSAAERRRLTPEHYFKSAEEMRKLFADLPEAVDNTLVVARRCAFMVETVKPILPPFDCGVGRDEADELRAQAQAGLERRLETQVFTPMMTEAEREQAARTYRERLDYELDVIVKMKFPGYFLIVADFIKWAKAQGIPVGPGRGSGAGSVVAWALTITDLDPLRWGLLFERFLNPDRVSMPDFDIDFCQDRRDEVIRYVQEKYGRDKVAQIITFGKLQARAVLRDVGRVLEMPYGYIDKICKLVPNNPANPVTLEQAVQAEPQLQRLIDEDADVKRLFDIAKPLEGLYRHASTHAAGVVIADRPLDELIPLYRDPRSDMPVTGFNMKYVESAGLVKFDFLGLKTLTVLSTAVDLIRDGGRRIDLTNLPLDDRPSYEMLGRKESAGVFQLESTGMQDVLGKLKPDTFEDIIAVVALYRPGPMDNIPSYIRRKHGDEQPDYLYPTLEGILKETFGIMIYQEQVMQIAQELSGYSLGGADLLRRAMGKKIKEEMDKQRATFVAGAAAKGVPEQKASDIFDQVDKFAGYGFNKSHAAAYALVAYQTAYLKANYPVEFFAASMTLDMNNTDKLNGFREELRRLNVPLLPPDINASGVAFTVERDKEGKAKGIRYGLAAVKNVGAAAMATLIAERKAKGRFKTLADLANRLDARAVNKRQLENLVRAGALDGLNPNRRQMFEGLEILLRHAQAAGAERDSGQIGLFGGGGGEPPALKLPEGPDWPYMERLNEEADAIGFYLSGHPLDAYAKSLERLGVRRVADVIRDGHAGPVALAGTVIGRKERTSAKGSRYAFVRLSDVSGVFEVTLFSEVLATGRDMLEAGNSIFVKGSVQFEGETARFTANSIEPLDQVTARAAAGLKVACDGIPPLAPLRGALAAAEKRGRGRVCLVSRIDGLEVEIDLGDRFAISPSVLAAVRAIPGLGGVEEI
ncbi:MAG: DNA polymerase III subunit alpha [Magnetospirillum sp. WYHS-4]